jgi:hypothetical protein
MFYMRYLISSLCLALYQCQPINLKTGSYVTSTWLETGYTEISNLAWTTIKTKTNDFIDPIVLVSLPEIGGLNYTDGYPTAIRLKNIEVDASGYVSFQTKIYLPTDVQCTGYDYSSLRFDNELVSWTVVEKGGYNLTEHYFYAFNGSASRVNQNLADTSNHFDIFFGTGCLGDADAGSGQCQFRGPIEKEDIAYVSQIQSLNNDMYLLSRGKFNSRSKVVMVLSPHDANIALYPSYYTLAAENLGIFAFEKGLAIACKEGLSFETGRETSITSNAFQVTFALTYKYAPGAYAMLNSLESLVDSTGLRVVQKSTTAASIITQEDMCVDNEEKHKTPENAGYLFVGASSTATTLQCFVYYEDPVENVTCSTVTAYDLFGDGWGDNVFLRVSTWGKFSPEGTLKNLTADLSYITTVDYSTSCTCTEITFCSDSGIFNVSVVTTEGSVVRHPWEIYWEYLDDYTNITWIGDIDTSIGIDNNEVVWYMDLVDYNITSEENECDTCPHKPKPPKKDDDGKGKDDEKEEDEEDSKPKKDDDSKGKDDDKKEDDKDSKPKPPPAKVLIQLFDSDNDGWYDDVLENEWVNPCNYMMFPNVLSYPRYYISNDDRTKLIHSGSLCLHDDKEICEEILPREGEFVYRVAGFDDNGDASITWDFCGVKGTLGQELEFSMKGGKCVAGALVSASDYCEGIVSLAHIRGEILLGGVFNDKLTEYDTQLLEHMISSGVGVATVTVTSWLVKRDVGLYVDFTLTMEMEQLGYEGIFSDMRSAFHDDLLSKLTTASTQGLLLNYLSTTLSLSPNSQNDILNKVTSIEVIKFEISSVTFSKGQDYSTTTPVEEDVIVTHHSSGDTSIVSFTNGAMVFIAVVVGGALVIFTVSRVMRKKPYQALPESSEHL